MICIVCTEPNLKGLGFRFIEDCYDLFKNNQVDNMQRERLFKIEQIRMNLWNDNKVCETYIKNAINEKRPLDSVITNVAKYLVDLPH